MCFRLSLYLPRSPCSLIIKVHWYIITVHIYLKSRLGEWEASPPLLCLCIIKCYYLHPVQLLSHPLIKSAPLRKLTTSYANWKTGEKKRLAAKAWAACQSVKHLHFPSPLIHSVSFKSVSDSPRVSLKKQRDIKRCWPWFWRFCCRLMKSRQWQGKKTNHPFFKTQSEEDVEL